MKLDAYARALTGARDAVSATYVERVGAPVSDDLALALGMAAVKAFLDVAGDELTVGAHVNVLRPDLGEPERMNGLANREAARDG